MVLLCLSDNQQAQQQKAALQQETKKDLKDHKLAKKGKGEKEKEKESENSDSDSSSDSDSDVEDEVVSSPEQVETYSL